MELKISSFKRIVVLTGAGISAESGISTFRDSGGLWENYRIENVATPGAFEADPKLVWQFYSMRRRAAAKARPNKAHQILAAFGPQAKASGIDFTLVTQNVDALHERAIAETNPVIKNPKTQPNFQTAANWPITMHGTLSASRCSGCGQIYHDTHAWFDEQGQPCIEDPFWESHPSPLLPVPKGVELNAESLTRDQNQIPLTPCCQKQLRPHIVWFGEMPIFMDEIAAALENCDLFVTIGTSGQVYPAAGFLQEAKIAGAVTVCLNKEPIPQRAMVDYYLEGPATQTVPSFFQL